MLKKQVPNESFRVPNSIIQNLTTATQSGANRLGTFPTATLLGLFTLVNPKRPEDEVETKISQIAEIIEVGRNAEHAVKRDWPTAAGIHRCEVYTTKRHSPTQIRQINDALVSLFNQSVVIPRKPTNGRGHTERTVHILDMFGYRYRDNDRVLDIDDLPAGKTKVNTNTDERAVWRVQEAEGRLARPTGVYFRLNSELARELMSERGTIGFTVLARRVFGVLRELRDSPAATRLLMTILRQWGERFTRHLTGLLTNLGWTDHPKRAVQRLSQALGQLKATGIVVDYTIDQDTDQVTVGWNKKWWECEPAEFFWHRCYPFLAQVLPVFGTGVTRFWHRCYPFLAQVLPEGRFTSLVRTKS